RAGEKKAPHAVRRGRFFHFSRRERRLLLALLALRRRLLRRGLLRGGLLRGGLLRRRLLGRLLRRGLLRDRLLLALLPADGALGAGDVARRVEEVQVAFLALEVARRDLRRLAGGRRPA